jgi:putative Mg2+ transporter-C (MgtC) family protein
VIVLPFGLWALRLAVALILGAILGLERERREGREQAAGLRTLALVAMGAALISLISAYGFTDFASSAYAKVDPSRVIAQIVSGIGFLGAGAIFLHKDYVQGLTTAAAIWFVAGVGMACGLGLLWEAALATALSLVVLEVVRPLERRLVPNRATQKYHLLLAPQANTDQVIRSAYDVCTHAGVTINSVRLRSGERGDTIELHCRTRASRQSLHIISELRALPQVTSVEMDIEVSNVIISASRVPTTPTRDETPLAGR